MIMHFTQNYQFEHTNVMHTDAFSVKWIHNYQYIKYKVFYFDFVMKHLYMTQKVLVMMCEFKKKKRKS